MSTRLTIISRNILIAAAYKGVTTIKDTARLLAMPEQTYRDRISEPGRWRLGELLQAADKLDVTLDWLLGPHNKLNLED